jgi:small-conductance mechanosensitive channel
MNEGDIKYIIGFSLVLAGLVLGGFFEFVILKKIRTRTANTRWKGDDILVYSLKGLIFASFALIGGYLMLRYVYHGDKIEKIGNQVFFSGLVLATTIFFARLVAGIIQVRSASMDGMVRTGSIMANLARVVIFILGILIILQGYGVSITPMLTALGVGGLAVALALQDTLSNLFSGVQVIASKQIRPGNYIKLDSGEDGYVSDITWRNTTIRTLSNNVVIVPNSKIAAAILTNYSLPDKEMAVLVDVSVSYSSDLEKVERVTIETAEWIMQSTAGAVRSHKPFIRYHTFADSGISFSVILRVREYTDQYLIKHEFIKTLYKTYIENQIEIPFPTRTIRLKTEHTNEKYAHST